MCRANLKRFRGAKPTKRYILLGIDCSADTAATIAEHSHAAACQNVAERESKVQQNNKHATHTTHTSVVGYRCVVKSLNSI